MTTQLITNKHGFARRRARKCFQGEGIFLIFVRIRVGPGRELSTNWRRKRLSQTLALQFMGQKQVKRRSTMLNPTSAALARYPTSTGDKVVDGINPAR